MAARDLRDDDAPLVAHLVAVYPFKPYRDYRVWSRLRQRAIMQREVERSLAAAGQAGVPAGEGDVAVITLCRPLEWDTRFCGVPMGRIDWVLRGIKTL